MAVIACVDMDCYFVSVERRLNPALAGKPVIVGGDPNARGVVSACSYETRRYGVHSGMALFQAFQRCPEAVFLQPNFQAYHAYSAKVYQFLTQQVPVVIAASIDEFYLDLTGCEAIYGELSLFVRRLKQYIDQAIGLPCTAGVGADMHIAKVACNLAKPSGFLRIEPGSEAVFLAPLPIETLQGVGGATEQLMHKLGIRTIGQLAQLPMAEVVQLFGKGGLHLYRKARGERAEGYVPAEGPRKSMGCDHTFSRDTQDLEILCSYCCRIAEKLGRQLRQEQLKAGSVTVKIRYSDFKTETTRELITPTDYDQVLYQTASRLLRRILKRRVSVRLVGVSLSRLQSEYAASLFDPPDQKPAMYQAMDEVRDRWGAGLIQWGASARARSRVPAGV